MILKIISKRIEQKMNLENGKDFSLSLPVSGSAHSSLFPTPRGLLSPPPSFLLCAAHFAAQAEQPAFARPPLRRSG
jgi:hypothetical protein